MDEKFVISREIGAISNPNNGWTKELNFISWNNREPVYDIRTWSENREKVGKGVTLTINEARRLRDLLNSLYL
jgi:hypothetical protein